MAATYEPIATTTLGSAASSITFSSIPSTYTDLRLVFVGTAVSGSSILFNYNSDTGNNYSRVLLQGNGTAASSSSQSNSNGSYAGTWYSSNPCFTTIDIFSYAGSTYKTSLITTNADLNGSGNVRYIVSLWRSTSAINSVTFSIDADNFAAGTVATIYGVKSA
jgi:hypothetical protein